MDKIKEVMELVDAHASAVERSVATGDSSIKFFTQEKEARQAIEAKLRELLEREPLSDAEIEREHLHELFKEGVRFAERAHGIGNESKEM